MARSIDNRSNLGERDLTVVRESRTLESFVEAATDREGLSLASLRPNARLLVRTRNTLYRLVVLGPGPTVLVEGGWYFPELTEAQFYGSSLGGSALKTYWIGLGFQMELSGPTGRVVTSPIRSIDVEGDSVHGPF